MSRPRRCRRLRPPPGGGARRGAGAGPGPARAHGFTLLELLVGVSAFALLSVALYSGFQLGGRSLAAGERASDHGEQLRLVSGFVRRELGHAQPIAVSDGRRWAIWFEGGAERVRFLTDVRPRHGLGGLHVMEIRVEEEAGERSLTVARAPFHPDLDSEALLARAERSVLAEGLAAAEFAYFGSTRRGRRPDWHGRWDAGRQLPWMVRLRVVGPGRRPWPDLAVTLPVRNVRFQATASAQRLLERDSAGGTLGTGPPPEPGAPQADDGSDR